MTLATWCGGAAPLRADDAAAAPTFDLTPRLGPQAGCQATVTLEAGGELLVPAESGRGEKRLPLSIVARLEYQEQLVRWSDDMEQGARSVRRYTTATANTKTDAQSQELKLPENRRLAAVDSSDLGTAIRALDGPLTRDEFILLDAVGNTLVIDRLLPKRALAEGDGWDHDPGVMAALLGMDHIAVCEVRSVVTGQENGQVQIRLAGTVHGTVHGARTEMELRGAYLFHTQRGRISKLNLAIKELRKPGEAAPGLDLTARVSVVAAPLPASDAPAFDAATLARVEKLTRGELRELIAAAPERGFRFRHDQSWHAVHETREMSSFKLLVEGELLARCSVAMAPPRPEAKPMTLAEFERDVLKALETQAGKVAAATEWTTPAGYQCLGVFVDGSVSGGAELAGKVEVQWRYFHLSAPGRPQATVAVTVERGYLERFADADRPLVDSFELVAAAKTAAASAATSPK